VLETKVVIGTSKIYNSQQKTHHSAEESHDGLKLSGELRRYKYYRNIKQSKIEI
jgi:hypothetical protein